MARQVKIFVKLPAQSKTGSLLYFPPNFWHCPRVEKIGTTLKKIKENIKKMEDGLNNNVR